MDAINDIFSLMAAILDGWLRGFLPGALVDLIMMLVAIGAIVLFVPLIFLVMTFLIRKVIARIQDRYGPNRVGPLGILQPIADMIKMFTKEDIVPDNADRIIHFLAPIVSVTPVLLVFAVVPWSRGAIGRDLNIGILYVVAVSSATTMFIMMAGWGSNNKFALLGGMRAVAQLVSYEIPMVLSIVVAVMFAGSLSMVRIVEAQGGLFGLGWFVFAFPVGPLAFLVYFIAALAEVNSTPFDIPEAESEIIAGYHTEYTGMKFGMFQMTEFVGTFAQACLATTLFLGGWQGPLLPPFLWFAVKVSVLVFVFWWLKGTLPRFRVDQLMGFAWKVLVPIALGNIFVAGLMISTYQSLVR